MAAELRQHSASDGSMVVMLLHVFRATVVNEEDTLGAALRDYTLGPVSPVTVSSWPLTFALTVAALLGAVPTGAALAITSLPGSFGAASRGGLRLGAPARKLSAALRVASRRPPSP
jgi:hypothetical protein